MGHRDYYCPMWLRAMQRSYNEQNLPTMWIGLDSLIWPEERLMEKEMHPTRMLRTAQYSKHARIWRKRRDTSIRITKSRERYDNGGNIYCLLFDIRIRGRRNPDGYDLLPATMQSTSITRYSLQRVPRILQRYCPGTYSHIILSALQGGDSGVAHEAGQWLLDISQTDAMYPEH